MLTIETTMMLANLVTESEATDSKNVFDCYSSVSDDESNSVNLRVVLSMLDGVSLSKFEFCMKEKVSESVNMQSLIGVGPVVMDVLANIQINISVI